MVKKIVRIEHRVEVAPPPVVFPVKPSHCPKLETIREDIAEEGHEDFYMILDLNFSWFYQILTHFRVGLFEKAVVIWSKPDFGWVKVNTNGASRGNPGPAGCGGVLRDSSGSIIAGFSKFINHSSNVHAELMSILFGLELAMELDLPKIWIESDSLVSIQLLQAKPPFYWQYQDTILLIQDQMKQREVRISHIYREGNSVADFLANLSIDSGCFSVFNSSNFPSQACRLAKLDFMPTFRGL
ncbi:hypothetical protein DH2020_028157 [Rehmannia glutinosa]|uniref:RNase H type-1 domain-containing protein n=1 Tax=Rehmannia glutinosa TaxID=99300 RepID=A0ABR0VTY3_REHGL